MYCPRAGAAAVRTATTPTRSSKDLIESPFVPAGNFKGGAGFFRRRLFASGESDGGESGASGAHQGVTARSRPSVDQRGLAVVVVVRLDQVQVQRVHDAIVVEIQVV